MAKKRGFDFSGLAVGVDVLAKPKETQREIMAEPLVEKVVMVDVVNGNKFPVELTYKGEYYNLSPSSSLKNVSEVLLKKPLPKGVYLVPKN